MFSKTEETQGEEWLCFMFCMSLRCVAYLKRVGLHTHLIPVHHLD
jgi:hypothetical protein